MVGIYAAVANANHMATWGGTELLLGTNPLAIGVPSGSGPIVLDMATSIVAYGTVKKYALRDLAMPQGWFVNPETGEAITDPKRSHEGVLLPMGEYKGSGLALMLGFLGGVLNGAAFGRDVVDFNADDKSETNTGHFICVVDIARFLPLAISIEHARLAGNLDVPSRDPFDRMLIAQSMLEEATVISGDASFRGLAANVIWA